MNRDLSNLEAQLRVGDGRQDEPEYTQHGNELQKIANSIAENALANMVGARLAKALAISASIAEYVAECEMKQ